MNNKLKLVAIFFLIASCKTQVDLAKEIPGTYTLSQQDIARGQTQNTLKDLHQMKVYTDSHFMYAQINPDDSISAFGVGTYTTAEDTLTENVIFSASGETFNDQQVSYNLGIKITPEGYNQVIKGIVINGDSSTLTEVYNRVRDTTTSPLDGTWKELRSYLVKGTDTTFNNRNQYKTFYRGYFLFGNATKAKDGKTETNMGYGTFKMLGPNQFTETDLNSSLDFVAGNTFTIDFVSTDNDHYNQTITNADSSRSVEFYERLKK